jgi:predicted membrane-bound spermidine synthase
MRPLSLSIALASVMLTRFFWPFNGFLAAYYFALALGALVLHYQATVAEMAELEAERMFAIVQEGTGRPLAYAMTAEEAFAMRAVYAMADAKVVNLETGEVVEVPKPRPISKAQEIQ